MSRLGLTRVAFGCAHRHDIPIRQAPFTVDGAVRLTSARIPRRDLAGGSLFWIIRHTLVARQAILSVSEIAGATGSIAELRLAADIQPVSPRHHRAHQGWRYLPEPLWPPDEVDSPALPPDLAAELAGLALL